MKRIIAYFSNMFGFEKGIDIANDCAVLFRKNIVIKNIVFLSNLFYTALFTIISIGDPSNWVVTLICFPLTFFVNSALKRMISKDKDNYLKQQIAMYMACFYMFLSAILIYFKMRNGSQTYLGEVGYILIYYSIVVCSLYQDKKMQKVVSQWIVIIITILHFTLTYNIIDKDYSTDLYRFVTEFFVSIEFKDILMRTIILILFMIVVYCIVAMSSYMQDERKVELVKRRNIQADFTNVVTDIFEVTLNNNNRSEDEIRYVELVALMAKRLSSIVGKTPAEGEEIYEYAKVHISQKVDFSKNMDINNDEEFAKLQAQTVLGSRIISRLQLERKCEDIIRAHMEGSNSTEFVTRMRGIQNEIDSQIILFCDMYVSLRSMRSYKKAYNHRITMQYLEEQFKTYYDVNIYDRFVRFQSDFEKMYDEF